jgi:RHS repeat-associated protein
LAKRKYDSFGNLTASSGSTANPFRFTGREFDSETGLYFHRARNFAPNVGRFISQDPIRFGGGVDFYVYVGNNPLTRIDPSGTDPYDWIANRGNGGRNPRALLASLPVFRISQTLDRALIKCQTRR